MSKIKEINKFEKCVMCQKETNVNKDSHIDTRTTYVEGAG